MEAQGIPIESPTRVQLMVYSTFEASGTFRVDPSVTAKLANIVLTARSNYHFVPAEQNIFEITSMTKRRGSNAPDHCILFKLVGIDADTSLVLGESLPFVVVRRLDQQRLYRRAALRELRRCRGEDVPADPKVLFIQWIASGASLNFFSKTAAQEEISLGSIACTACRFQCSTTERYSLCSAHDSDCCVLAGSCRVYSALGSG